MKSYDRNNLKLKNIFNKTSKLFSGPIVGLIVIIILFSLFTPDFFTLNNFINIFNQLPVYGVLAIGMTFVILTGGIDLSVGCILGLSSMIMGFLATSLNVPFVLAIIISIFVGTLFGLVSGLLISRLHLPAFIATLAMYYVARGLANVITEGKQILGYPSWLMMLSFKKYLGFITINMAIFIFFILICNFLLEKTRGGRDLYAVGGNIDVARLCGININNYILLVYVISGFMSAIAGIMTASRVCSSEPSQGNGYELYAIAIAVIGGASLNGGTGSMKGTLIGCLVIGVLSNGLNLNGVSPFVQTVLIGVLISFVVGIDMLSIRKKNAVR
jgi:ribose transport system permease protein